VRGSHTTTSGKYWVLAREAQPVRLLKKRRRLPRLSASAHPPSLCGRKLSRSREKRRLSTAASDGPGRG
jgi:hypothetical protein